MSDPSNVALPGVRPARNPRSPDREDGPFPDDIGPLSEFREILDLLPVMVYVKDAEGRFIFANREAHEAYGASPGTLTRRQQQLWIELLGKKIEVSKLGHLRFKAPEFDGQDGWFNSTPLTLRQLKGKVVALHFYAFA